MGLKNDDAQAQQPFSVFLPILCVLTKVTTPSLQRERSRYCAVPTLGESTRGVKGCVQQAEPLHHIQKKSRRFRRWGGCTETTVGGNFGYLSLRVHAYLSQTPMRCCMMAKHGQGLSNAALMNKSGRFA